MSKMNEKFNVLFLEQVPKHAHCKRVKKIPIDLTTHKNCKQLVQLLF